MERKYFTGFIPDTHDDRDVPLCAAPSYAPGGGIPSAASIASKYPPALEQGNTMSCSSNATANALRYLLRVGGHPDVPQSRLFIYWNARTKLENNPGNSDPGLQIRSAMKSVANFNSVSEATWPFDPVPERVFIEPSAAAYEEAKTPDSFSYESVPQNEQSIKSAIAAGRPVVLGIELRQSFYSVGSNGIATPMTGGVVGWHAVTIVGYDDSTRMFELQNSWGTSWGKNGFFYLSYDFVTNPSTASDLWSPKAFSDGVVKPAPIKMVIRASDGSSVKPIGSAPCGVTVEKGSNFAWYLVATGPDTYTVSSPEHANTYLSCTQTLGRVDAFTKDDESGRQRWTFNKVSGRKFKITVEKGLDSPSDKFLTVAPDGSLSLKNEENDGDSQIFNVGE